MSLVQFKLEKGEELFDQSTVSKQEIKENLKNLVWNCSKCNEEKKKEEIKFCGRVRSTFHFLQSNRVLIIPF